MAVKRGPAKACARPAAWRWQLICAAVSVAAGACCFASGAPPLPGVYIDEEFMRDLTDSCVKQHSYGFFPLSMDDDPLYKKALGYLSHHIPGVGDAVMEQFRVGAECPDDPEQHDVAIRVFEDFDIDFDPDWGKKFLAARPELEPVITYGIAFREEEFEILTNLIFKHSEKMRKPGVNRKSRYDFKKEVEAKLGRSVTTAPFTFFGGPCNEPKDLPNGMESWFEHSMDKLPNGLFEITIDLRASRFSNIKKKVTLRYTGIYRWTPEEGPTPHKRFQLTEFHYPDFANYSESLGRGEWEATRTYHDTWDGDRITVTKKSEPIAFKGKRERATNGKTYIWRKGNDPRANKFRENMRGEIKYNNYCGALAPPKVAIIDITREKFREDDEDEAFKTERIFDLDPIPAKFRLFRREEAMTESGTKALHYGMFIHAKSLGESAEWSTLGSTFAFEVTKIVERVPKRNDPSKFARKTISTHLRIAAQTGPNERFLHIGNLVAGKRWESDTVMYEENPEMAPSTRGTELIEFMRSEKPSSEKSLPDLAKQLEINGSNQGSGGRGNGSNTAAFGGGTSRNDPERPYNKNLSILGELCTGGTLYLVANRLLSSYATPKHSRLAQVGQGRN